MSADRVFPRLERRGSGSRLIVDGEPFLALGGELHNSSPSSPAYLAPVWDRLAAAGVRSVIGAASWQLVEPEEGVFDFLAVDDQIVQARARGIRLILIWFGSYKNAESSYAPSWVRRDEERFPRAERDEENLLTGRFSLDGPILSVFGEDLLRADARAFTALMAHLRDVDPEHTVIAVQVQNEVGLLGDSRDRGPLAEAAWSAPVPPALLDGLAERGDALQPWLRELWTSQGARSTGSWAEVFGSGREADEVFMAWGFCRFVNHVAAAGEREYPLPMFTNAWLGPQPNAALPGQYPSGGPVARMIDVWQIGAPTLALLAPDIYIEDFAGAVASFDVPGNAILVPEARPEPGLASVAVGAHAALGFHVFGIEDVLDHEELFREFEVLQSLSSVITDAQIDDRIHGFRLAAGASETVELGGYSVTASGPLDTRGMFGEGTGDTAAVVTGYGVVVHLGGDEFLVAARGATVRFSRPGELVEWDTLTEETFVDGQWRPGRTLNGDERYFMFPTHDLRVVRIELLRRPIRARR
ncbi:DUF5597 domain-containing protein [Rathayibacter sp. VKM Ac-2928]|uniref:GH35 family beta-galactosidase n=1 Tax=Rathayibacter sp. VKM Ac-2928 TaxID=2929479 RepID=UPI001FB1D8F2|nr:DUF5597 domain-containing protein [Rathayibacter sp. VKM Ac-2928]MCJ1682781.1 DUF5597 domain-containing protein [Rathayibacter sp. VKM Ac-2928]